MNSVISLFTGAGGLDIGLEAAGFDIAVCLDNDPNARGTVKKNRQQWNLMPPDESDIDSVTASQVLSRAQLKTGEVTLISAGPPCQPFSKARFWAAGQKINLKDPRVASLRRLLEIIEHALPNVWLIENVPGLRRRAGHDGLSLIEERVDQINRRHGTNYDPVALEMNAADYGVPQRRRRLFIVAQRDGRHLQPPDRTHAEPEVADRVGCEPFRTAWDAIGDLDSDMWPEELQPRGKYADFLPSIPEGQNYLWHTPEGIKRWSQNGRDPSDAYWGWRTRYWSFLLKLAKAEPSWTISASPGPSTGPFHWKSRLLSIRELCRLQTFPDDYVVSGSRKEQVRQIGNAVPCALGETIGLAIRRQLLGEKHLSQTPSSAPNKRNDCPEPEQVHAVPQKYHRLQDRHDPHPGEGKGPGAVKRELERKRP